MAQARKSQVDQREMFNEAELSVVAEGVLQVIPPDPGDLDSQNQDHLHASP